MPPAGPARCGADARRGPCFPAPSAADRDRQTGCRSLLRFFFLGLADFLRRLGGLAGLGIDIDVEQLIARQAEYRNHELSVLHFAVRSEEHTSELQSHSFISY